MFRYETSIRVRYGETDQMGYVYYGNYALYYEVARVEALRSLGFTYKKLEEDGVMLPVIEMYSRFIKPAYYDDEILIKVSIKEPPVVKIGFTYELYNSSHELLNTAEVTLAFIEMKTGKPTRCPQELFNRINSHILK